MIVGWNALCNPLPRRCQWILPRRTHVSLYNKGRSSAEKKTSFLTDTYSRSRVITKHPSGVQHTTPSTKVALNAPGLLRPGGWQALPCPCRSLFGYTTPRKSLRWCDQSDGPFDCCYRNRPVYHYARLGFRRSHCWVAFGHGQAVYSGFCSILVTRTGADDQYVFTGLPCCLPRLLWALF